MANITVTYTFQNNTTADASQVNTNLSDIINGTSDGTKDFSISALTCAGNVSLNANVTLGNASGDDITFTGSLASTIPIKTDGTYDIGSSALGLNDAYFGDGGGNTVKISAPSIAANYTLTLPGYSLTLPASDGSDGHYLKTNGAGVASWADFQAPSSVSDNSGQTITTATVTKVTFNTTDFDADSNISSSTFTAPVAGKYLVNAQVTMNSLAVAVERVEIQLKNSGGTILAYAEYSKPATSGSIVFTAQITRVLSLASSATVEVHFYHNRGSNVNLASDTNLNFFQVSKIQES